MSDELLQIIIDNQLIMLDNQTTLIGQNDVFILNQATISSQYNIIISLIIVATVIMFWFKRRRTKWM